MSLSIRVFGPLTVVRDGAEVSPGGPKQAAVLAALLADRATTVSIERIIDRLWDEEPPPTASATIQAYVSNLRRIVEPRREKGAPYTVIVTRGRGYALEVEGDAVDSCVLESRLAEGRGLLAAARFPEARAVIESGLALWRGEPYAGNSETFVRVEANRLGEVRAGAIEDLMQATIECGEHHAAIPRLEALVAEHPLRERVRVLLMLALYRSGRQADALAVYRDARRVLDEELGIEPGASLRAIEADILNQSPSLDAPGGVVVVAPEPPAVAPSPETPADASAALVGRGPSLPPIVGRTHELDRLDRALEDLAQGMGSVVVLHGEAGAGKTRLAEELHARAADRGMEVLTGSCLEGWGTPPFWLWSAVFRAAGLESRLSEERERDGSRVDVYFEIAETLMRRAALRPMVVVLDDIQWADVPSLELLRVVASAARRGPLLVCVTHRDTASEMSDQLRELLAALAREATVTRIAVRGLDEPEVGRLVAGAAGGAAPKSLVHSIFERTEGNPFFVTELLRFLEAEGSIAEIDVDTVLGTSVPVGVRDIVARHLSRLPGEAAEALEHAAVIGREFEVGLLARSFSGGEDAIDAAIDAAIGAAIVVTAGAAGRFRFTHDIVRHTIAGGIPPLRRARLHARVAAALLAAPADDAAWVSRLAHHSFEAAAVIGAAEAVPHVKRAADQALARLAYETAAEQYERALDLYDTLPPDLGCCSPALESATRLARLTSMLYGYASPKTYRALERTLALSEAVGASRELVVALFGLWGYHCVRVEFEDSGRYSQRLLDEADRRGDPVFHVAGHKAAGIELMQRGRFDEACRHLLAAIEMAQTLEDPMTDVVQQNPVVACKAFLSVACAYAGDRDGAEALLDEAIDIASAIGDPFSLAFLQMMHAWCHAVLHEAPECGRVASDLVVASDRYGFRLWSGFARIFLGWANAHQGDFEGGTALIREGLAGAAQTGARMLRPLFLGLLASAAHAAGRNDEAIAVAQEAKAQAQADGEHFHDSALDQILALSAASTSEALTVTNGPS